MDCCLFGKFKVFQKRVENMQLIKSFKIFGITILNICFDGLYDNYLLFNVIPIFKTENDRHFWNEWESIWVD